MDSAQIKQCCSAVYGSEAARLLLGDSFHPGGEALTTELGSRLQLDSGCRVLDVASGRGTSAFLLARTFGCRVVGVDLSRDNVEQATSEAAELGEARVSFLVADAETLPFEGAVFDAIVCECAFCTFPDKAKAAAEFNRVLKPGGRVGISDLTRNPEALPGLEGLLAWIACIGDAQPLEQYAAWLQSAGLSITASEQRDSVLAELVNRVRGKIFLADVMNGLGKVKLPGFDPGQANEFARAAADAVERGQLGYAILTAAKPS